MYVFGKMYLNLNFVIIIAQPTVPPKADGEKYKEEVNKKEETGDGKRYS